MTTATDPVAVFRDLFAKAAKVCDEPDAMVLSTVDEDGQPSGRFVLLKGVDERGFVFYTNQGSRKARALRANRLAALCIYWSPLGQQVRVEGTVESVSDAESDAYFATRPRDSQIGAWASAQSTAMRSRDELEARVAEFSARFANQPIPRPPFWSGLRVVPQAIEFWTRDPARLHVRERHQRDGAGWIKTLLYP